MGKLVGKLMGQFVGKFVGKLVGELMWRKGRMLICVKRLCSMRGTEDPDEGTRARSVQHYVFPSSATSLLSSYRQAIKAWHHDIYRQLEC